ncbi:MAG: hypothetical protein IRY99_03455 [Isosphaeraceae bacterium]|nr:hypothetical protein [Isosphaeraceae bacterium]
MTSPTTAPRPLGRNTAATVQNWDRIVAVTPIAPRIFGGEVPRKSPNIRRFYHASFLSQRSRGFCVGFNTAGTFMTLLRIPPDATETTGEPLPLVPLSPLYTYDISRLQARQDGIALGPGDGSIGSSAFRGSAQLGVVRLEDYPSTPADIDRHRNGTDPGDQVEALGRQHLLTAYAICESWEHGLEVVASGRPAALCSPIPSGMLRTDAQGRFRMSGGIVGGHCYQFLDFDMDQDLAWIAQAWEYWGEQTDDPHYAPMHHFTQLGTCPLSELEKYFTPSAMSSGASEILVANTLQGWTPLITYDL